nr:ribbon-helix-helix domain-containing protein [uncultured Intestinibacter sp.]
MALKNRVRFSSTLDTQLHEDLKKLSEQSRINISKLLDEAIKDLLTKHKQEDNKH